MFKTCWMLNGPVLYGVLATINWNIGASYKGISHKSSHLCRKLRAGMSEYKCQFDQ